MKDKMGPILIVLVLIAAVVATTYSWFFWKTNEDDRIGLNFETNGANSECITYSVSQTGSKTLIPVTTKEKGYITSIDIAQTCDIDLYVDFKLKLDKLPVELKDETFKYTLIEGTRVVSEDSFEEKRQGETLTIATHELINNNPKNYKLYLWIDGNSENNNNMQEKHYEFNLEAVVTDKE